MTLKKKDLIRCFDCLFSLNEKCEIKNCDGYSFYVPRNPYEEEYVTVYSKKICASCRRLSVVRDFTSDIEVCEIYEKQVSLDYSHCEFYKLKENCFTCKWSVVFHYITVGSIDLYFKLYCAKKRKIYTWEECLNKCCDGYENDVE